jgi:hypothetical protein
MYFRTVFIAVSEFVQFWIEAIVVQCLLFLCNRSLIFSLLLGVAMKKCPLSVFIIRLFPILGMVVMIVVAKLYDVNVVINCGVALATFYAALVALWKDEYKEYSQRPVLTIGLSDRFTNVNGQIWRRLEISNTGRGIAKNVSIKISCDDPQFVPIRLVWTHIDLPLQNIEPNDCALCDIARFHEQGFCLQTEVDPGNSYTSFGLESKNFKLTISADNFPKVEKELKVKFVDGKFLWELR